MQMNSTNVAHYDDSDLDKWLENSETGFLSRFDSSLLSKLSNRSQQMYRYDAPGGGLYYIISRKCYVPSMGDSDYIKPIIENGQYKEYWCKNQTSSYKIRTVYTGTYRSKTITEYAYVRPMLNLKNDTKIKKVNKKFYVE